jgi:serine/threonine protein kinase
LNALSIGKHEAQRQSRPLLAVAAGRRTDIWAFGCCLYECLTGRSAFKGNTVTDTLAAVLNSDPDWSAVREDVPVMARRLLRRSLAKDLRHRLQHIGDARLELEDAETGTRDRSATSPRRFRSITTLAVVAFLVAAVIGMTFWITGRRLGGSSNQTATYLTLRLTGDRSQILGLTVQSFFVPFALSPDTSGCIPRGKFPN